MNYEIHNNKVVIFLKVKIVWNLTNKCPFNCAICAASANLREEKTINKTKILKSITSIGKNNVCIDFSGGDPLTNRKDIDLIKKASKMIGKENIFISTTGVSLENLSDEEVLGLSQNYDLTYDFPIKYNNLDKRDKRYNYKNFEQAKRIKNLGAALNIFIPLQNLEEYLIDELVKDLIELNPKSISIIRLMPVGSLSINDLIKFDEIKLYNKLKEKIISNNYKGDFLATCSLRTVINDKKGCNMVNEKYGVDHLGNLYSCIWASDIVDNNNPFKLGNLLENDLAELVTKKTIPLNKKECAVYKHIENKNN